MGRPGINLVSDTGRARAGRRSALWLACGLSAATTVAGIVVAPVDGWQGPAQRLMYLHVPAAWVAYTAFAVVLLASGTYLIGGNLRWDRFARCAAEIGVVLTAVTIGTGALWGHLVWGTWWAWDPRLVSTVLLLLAYAGYLGLRRLAAERTGGPDGADHAVARPAAYAGIVAFLLVPVVHFSVVWWRSLHQPATVLAPERPPIDPRMGAALLLAVGAVTVWAFCVLVHRVVALERRLGAEPAADRTRVGVG
ncbi:cytochrome c biogenesis protein CcsA [Polymorphospora rubra]|uniref:cytochrome c biogenesis protein CcsA n=1 Tax=Polymorphospora rubra TaxID=338584 RepID=UPI0033D8A25A